MIEIRLLTFSWIWGRGNCIIEGMQRNPGCQSFGEEYKSIWFQDKQEESLPKEKYFTYIFGERETWGAKRSFFIKSGIHLFGEGGRGI